MQTFVTTVQTSARVSPGRDAVQVATVHPPRFRLDRELVTCTALTATLAATLLAFGPAPGDAAVHLYRTFLVQHGALLWDNYWYKGHYPLAGYSLLYYLPASVVGNLPLVLGAAVLATLLFASLVRREWGDDSIWASRVFGVCAAAPLFTGLYSYSVAFTAALGSLWALQRKRLVFALVLAALTLGLSPLAFAFLSLVLLSVVIARRRLTATAVKLAAGVALLAAFQLVVLRLFPVGGVYPFHPANLAGVLGVSITGFLLTRRLPAAKPLAAFFVLWGATSVFFFTVSSPVGGNWTRLGEFSFPLMLLAATLARFRPRRLVAVALAVALAYTLVPNLMLIPYRLDNRPARAAFWQPAIGFLARNARPGYRVEVVPTAAHWEAYWIPRAGFALARGWYRQLDMVDNPALYSRRLDAAAYRRWLRSQAVEYVLLPSTRLDPDGGPREAQVLRSAGLALVHHDRRWTIYRLQRPTPLVTGPGTVRIETFGHTTIAGTAARPGRYLFRNHYIPFWRGGPTVCVERAPNRASWLYLSRPGRFKLTVASTGDALLLAAHVEPRRACDATERHS
jgi:hypothetical protein